MRIAQIAPLWEKVPPPAYGGTELVVSLLTDELVRRGHDVTLFATGDSQTLAKLESVCPQALRLMEVSHEENTAYQILQHNRIYERANEFDLIHSHVDLETFPYADLVKTPTLYTVHGIITPDTEPRWRKARHQNFVSISNSQRRTDLELNYVATVYNGINTKIYPFYPEPSNPPYLAFLGRISPEKGPHLAIEIAKKTGWHLKMAGKIDPVDREFFEQQIKPLIDNKQIEYLGEANHAQKCELMGGAVATLFPITWKEPFGLVMAESMAVGTPLIAIAMGSTPEVIEHGKTGFLCHNVAECVAAVERIGEISRRACRDRVVKNFSVECMVDGYEAVYQQLISKQVVDNNKVPKLVADLNRLSA
ncbi:glycosyl transferase group 1 [Stanieria cyanosphaera PCC 7437]|uniref:Glycosyl transferase group 1 n=1 Tax=Stanieria cyanosphaera (strain ATCC 29371 / PCC 7437) TaxID=111780 RepID=K9XS66_STAC7|nr:glycosyltransferase family 4 protein [Stanieria cyanosphaera]AFZ34924.1 glycosyl transferase group 1 [Stanieria cyanosphaera PCC 7437]